MNMTIENMTIKSKPKNLLQEEKENTPSNPEKTPLSVEEFLEQNGVEWERKGRGVYVYPSSLEGVKKILEKVPAPNPDEYIIMPLGSTGGYNVFILVSRNGISIRIGYGRGNIPYSDILMTITEKVSRIAKDIGIENRRNGKNLLGV